MKACTIVAVSAALFTAKVQAEDFLLEEYFTDSSCTAANLMKMEYTAMECTGPRDEHREGVEYQGVYYQWACTSTTATRTWYSDDACTTEHPIVTETEYPDVTTDACQSSGDDGRYRKVTCPVTKSASEVFVYAKWANHGVADTTCTGTPGRTNKFFMSNCRPDSRWEDGSYTEKSQSYAWSGDVLTVTAYDSLDCSGTGTPTTFTCGACTSQGPFYYGQVTCPAADVVGAPRGASPGSLLAAAAAALALAVAGAA